MCGPLPWHIRARFTRHQVQNLFCANTHLSRSVKICLFRSSSRRIRGKYCAFILWQNGCVKFAHNTSFVISGHAQKNLSSSAHDSGAVAFIDAYCTYKGPFTRAIFVAQLDAIFVAPKLHEIARPVYTGDFCRATQCNFCRAEVASSFEHVRNLVQLRRDKNCIELRDKNRLCKRALRKTTQKTT